MTRDMSSLHLFVSAIEDFHAFIGAYQFNLKVMPNLSRLNHLVGFDTSLSLFSSPTNLGEVCRNIISQR
ncbi:hypothetical protein EYC80_000622 [Monilinia laxa]|uniref:Uncharacterized protein n=1 Tax=Monilinia laxa TaxID=61186 RepID=A0A5N6KB75_MONLA|nr:hypothetical protein EYC80_000622 [Monilinia laxa]